MKLSDIRTPKIEHYDYCPRCSGRTPHLKVGFQQLCKRCGKIYKRGDAYGL